MLVADHVRDLGCSATNTLVMHRPEPQASRPDPPHQRARSHGLAPQEPQRPGTPVPNPAAPSPHCHTPPAAGLFSGCSGGAHCRRIGGRAGIALEPSRGPGRCRANNRGGWSPEPVPSNQLQHASALANRRGFFFTAARGRHQGAGRPRQEGADNARPTDAARSTPPALLWQR
jgi:hypothetical protein